MTTYIICQLNHTITICLLWFLLLYQIRLYASKNLNENTIEKCPTRIKGLIQMDDPPSLKVSTEQIGADYLIICLLVVVAFNLD